MGQNFDRPLFRKFEAPSVGDLPTCLEIAGEALGLLGCVLKRLKINFDEIRQRRTCRPKWGKILIGPFPQITCLEIAGEALGLLGCVLKRLKILMKSDSAGPVGQNGEKF